MKRTKKNRKSALRAQGAQWVIGRASGAGRLTEADGSPVGAEDNEEKPACLSQRNGPRRWRSLTAVIAERVAKNVAIRVEPTMPVGFFEPLIARILMAVAGTSWIELVLIAKKEHIAL